MLQAEPSHRLPSPGATWISPGGGWRHLVSPAAAGAVLAAFWVFLQASLWEKSVTHDEIAHATAGFSYWKFNDYRLQPENGNLPQRVAALPLLSSRYPFPSRESAQWQLPDQWGLADQWFYKMGNDATGMLRRGRAVCGVFAVAMGALVWWWSRRLFGAWGGMLSLLLYVLSPAILANGALMTSDVAAALFFLVATLGWWRALHRLTVSRVLFSALAMGGLVVSKMSAPLIAPIALALLVARLISRQPLPVEIGRPCELAGRGRQLLAFAAIAAVHAAVVFAVVWSCYGFRYAVRAPGDAAGDWLVGDWQRVLAKPQPLDLLNRLGLRPEQLSRVAPILDANGVQSNEWTPEMVAAFQSLRQQLLSAADWRKLEAAMAAPPARLVPRVADFFRRHRLLPEAFVYGYAYVWESGQRRLAFMNGEVNVGGWRWFFPYAFLVTTPLAVFAVMLLALVGTAMRWLAPQRRSWGRIEVPPGASVVRAWWQAAYETLPLWTLWAFYWAAAIASHMDIGHRHILPTYPPLFVLCGAAAVGVEAGFGARRRAAAPRSWWSGRSLALALGLSVAALAVDVLGSFPNYLSYFNAFAGGPAHGYRHLVDSSLDWGQDLPGVKRYLDQHKVAPPVYFAYFGTGSPDWYGIQAQALCSKPGLGQEVPPLFRLEELPGGEVAPALAEIRRQHPDYDLVGTATTDRGTTAVLVEKPSALRLAGGTYLISATLLQPFRSRFEGGVGPWNQTYESGYQELRRAVAPLLTGDETTRAATLHARSPDEWTRLMTVYEHLRFARLTAFLRQREPDDNVNFSILVYRLSDADLARALDGPPAEMKPEPPWLFPGAAAGR
jgi:hypothetical protein